MLTARQQCFCDEYLVDLNKSRAYRAAYPSCKSTFATTSRANELLRKPEIIDYIRTQREERREKLRDRHEKAVQELEGVAYAPLGDVKVSTKDKLRALDLLCRHLGMFDPRYELELEEQQAQIDLLKLRIEKLQDELNGSDDDNTLRVEFVNTFGAEL